MIPILYEANETAFTSQGLGALADAVSVSVSRVINGKDELTMVYPATGIRYADIVNDRIVYAVPEYKKSAQPYQIYKITKPMNGLITVYARHVGSQRPGYIPVTPFTAGSLTETLNSLPNHLAETSPFTFWTNKTVTADFKLSRPASLGKVLGGMEGSILDVYGGEYEFDGYTIKLWNRRGNDSGVELRYGKNIKDIEQSEDFASLITGVVPYWEGLDGTTVTLPEVAVEGQYADTYSYRRTVVKDFSDKFDEEPTVAELRAEAQRYVSQSGLGVPVINLKVSFEHLAQYTGYENLQLLEKLNLGDTVSIFYDPLNVSATARIVSTTFDCLNEKYNSVQIGSVRSDLEQIMHSVSQSTTQIKESLQTGIPSAISEAVDNATDLITGANGGYIVIDRDANGKPYQILIMDTMSKATATNVIRINQNGIGFSTNGYSGPFATAWTIDGNFVADFITTGVLNAALAKIGLLSDALGKNSWNMATGEFLITDGSMTARYADPKTFYLADYDDNPDLSQNVDIQAIRAITLREPYYVTPEELERYDFNGDGYVRVSDLIKLRNMILAGKDLVRTRTAVIDPREEGVVTVWKTEYRDVPASKTEQLPNGFKAYASDYIDGVLGESYMFLDGIGLFGYTNGTQTAFYPADASTFLQENDIGVNKMEGCGFGLYSSTGTTTIELETDHTYLVTCMRRNSTQTGDDAAWLVSSHTNNSNIIALKSSSTTTASVSGLTLTVNRGTAYSRVTWTRLA